MQRTLLASLLLLMASGCAAGSDPCGDYDKVRRSLPRDAAALLDRGVNCNHFAGEFNGDRSARDQEINQVLTELRCDQVEREVAAIKRKYRADPAVLKAFRVYYDE
ncbi:hypothetical protein N8I74_04350 [Chitiniphilus purpureus]|uniref:Uncharacterized protein n=1 Tax=Chitiniphilus purpureus TaxID=2981137 RepID=A0ABY6DPG2_9NEIS|nr:hypothetical protein [Chitiniphilus sp. CD1]UXY16257.1 hypothetical protein N8I74_04350 [Chitiniphilus sp. CD1]